MEQFGKSVCTQQPTTAEGIGTKQKYIIGGATYLVSSHYKDSGARLARYMCKAGYRETAYSRSEHSRRSA